MDLKKYNEKRNFDDTPEPKGVKAKKSDKLSFVIQRHEASHLHYDFRLEMNGVLKSWAIPKGPSLDPSDKRLAVQVEDHPLPYGKFYGDIPKGNYGAGTVEIWDEGSYVPMEATEDEEQFLLSQLKKGDLKFILKGKHLKGSFALVRMNDGKDKNWLLIKKKDKFALDKYEIESIKPLKSKKKSKSVISVSTKKNSETKSHSKKLINESSPFPKELPQPMLAKLSMTVVEREDWIYEMKYDGYRVISSISKGNVDLYSRNGNSFRKLFQNITEELKAIQDDVILDGEVVIENDKGISDFQMLQNYQTNKEGVLKYYVFDILYLNGHKVTNFPLSNRKELLESFFKAYDFENIINSKFQIGKGKQLFDTLSKQGFEGIIAKDPESSYLEGKRGDTWLKIKSSLVEEAVICGFTEPQKSRSYFGAVLLGMYKNEELTYVGKCGTGFTDASLKELHLEFEKIKIKKCPFSDIPKVNGINNKIIWLRPELICNVKFSEWTNDNHLRNPVFLGLRTDKEIKNLKEDSKIKKIDSESPNEKELKLNGKKVVCTNLNKIYFPEDAYKKEEIIDYYQKISKYILPYLKNRPQSLNRHPNGIHGQSFYQKDMDVNKIPDWLKTEKLYSKSHDAKLDYLICNNEATLIYMANLGCIEINPWHSRYTKQDYPSYMILDLDPGEISFKEVVNTALVAKELCDILKIPAYCKTSGATGLHIYIPLGEQYQYDDIKMFAEILANIVHKRLPDTTSVERTVSKRKDKIYLDFLQNKKGQTIAAPYCVRPRIHATVSTPLMWKEVNENLSPQMFTIKNIEKRLEKVGDLWKPVLGKGIALPSVLKAIEKL
ncbi:MAG TPA: DNA ligase D [Edaphocola sp.]|nr:DNA ligase D [Edaphocola sp.]